MWVLGVLSLIYAAYKIISEKLEKPIPAHYRFDDDAYNRDIARGISTKELSRKVKQGAYWTDRPENLLVDIERYEHDKKYFGVEVAEEWRSQGAYKKNRDYYDHYKHERITGR